MAGSKFTRRGLLATTGATALVGGGLVLPSYAQSLAPTRSMRGGANNYRPGAPIVDRIGGGGFWMTGTVRRAGDGLPLPDQRIQIWAHTTEGHERDWHSHGATLTDANGVFRLEMPQILHAFGQAHGHLAYDSDEYETVFLRPVMSSSRDTALNADFVLKPVRMFRNALIWSGVALLIAVPFYAAVQSPLLQWRQPVYIFAGFAGIVALGLLLMQPMLAMSALPGFSRTVSRRIHFWSGIGLALTVALHVAGLWITSPPDVVDALLFVSPTPFSVWGVLAMWVLFVIAFLAVFRRRLRVPPKTWKRTHGVLTMTMVAGTIAHALLIEGAMEPTTKALLCAAVAFASVFAVWRSLH